MKVKSDHHSKFSNLSNWKVILAVLYVHVAQCSHHFKPPETESSDILDLHFKMITVSVCLSGYHPVVFVKFLKIFYYMALSHKDWELPNPRI